MIIDAKKYFSKRGVAIWFQKISGSKTRQSGDVIPLHAEPEISSEQIPVNPLVIFSKAEKMQLRDSTTLLIINLREIADCFYKKVVYFMWWNRDDFHKLVADESGRLLQALVGHAQNPSQSVSLAFFLADTWVKYRFKGDLGEPYDTITGFLAEAMEDVLWKQLSPGARDAWEKALNPGHVFDTGLGFGAPPASGRPRLNSNH